MNISYWAKASALLLILTAGTTAALLDTFRHSFAPKIFELPRDKTSSLLTRRTSVDNGPTLTLDIDKNQIAALKYRLDGIAEVAPYRFAKELIETPDGSSIGASLLRTSPELAQLLAATPGLRPDECAEPKLILEPSLIERLGLELGTLIKVGESMVRLGAAADANQLSALPLGTRIDGAVCSKPFQPDAEAAFVMYTSTIGFEDLRSRIGPPEREKWGESSWSVVSADDIRDQAYHRDTMWLRGVEIIVIVLSVGGVIILSTLCRIANLEGERIRKLLGERTPHRLRRFLVANAISFPLVGLAAAACSAAIIQFWGHLDPTIHLDMKGIAIASLTSAAIAMVLLMLFEAIKLIPSPLTLVAGVNLAAGRSTKSRRSLLLISALAAALCAALAIPSGSLNLEFARLSQIPQGYAENRLYSAELITLDSSSKSRSMVWDDLQNLTSLLRSAGGVQGVGAIEPAPWSYRGWPGVVSGEERVALQVSVLPGTLSLIQPTSFEGRDFSDSAGDEVIIQGVPEEAQTGFVGAHEHLVGKTRNIKFSPFSTDERIARFVPMNGSVPSKFELIVRANNNINIERINEILGHFDRTFIVSGIRHVPDLLNERLSRVRVSSVISLIASSVAIALLLAIVIACLHIYLFSCRAEMAVRLCLGASRSSLATWSLSGFLAFFICGWLFGSVAGFAFWQFLVDLMEDYRLQQSLSWGLVTFPVIALIISVSWLYSVAQTDRLDLRSALSSG